MPLLIWDLDGTLVDSRADIANAGNVARRGFGLAELPAPAIAAFVGDGIGKLLERLFADTPGIDQQEARIRFDAAYDQVCLEHTRPYPGITDVLDRFDRLGWRQAVASNKALRFTRKICDGLGLTRHLRALRGGDGPRKPDPGQLIDIARELGATLADGWMIGDHHTDILAGNAAGTKVCWVAWGIGHQDGQRVDAVAHHPHELPSLIGSPR